MLGCPKTNPEIDAYLNLKLGSFVQFTFCAICVARVRN